MSQPSRSSGWRLVPRLVSSPLAMRLMVMQLVFFTHAHHSFKRYYGRLYGTSKRACSNKSLLRQLNVKQESAQPIWAISGSGELIEDKKREAIRHQAAGRLETNLFELASDAGQWDWRGVPEKPWLQKLYDAFSIFYMCYALIRSCFKRLLFPWLDQLLGQWVGLPARCIFMGHFIFHPSIEELALILFTSFHLSWRLTQRFSGRHYMLGAGTFLLQSERDIKRFLKLMWENRNGFYLTNSHVPINFDLADGCPIVALVTSRLEKYADLRALICDSKAKLSVHEHFLRHLMCYEVYSERGIYYKLRPNRTLEAHRKLAHHLVQAFTFCACLLLSTVVTFTPVVVLIILSDYFYAQHYAGCSPQLDRLLAAGKLGYLSQSFSGHHLVSDLWDNVENAVVWFESGIATTLVLGFTYFLNCDILLYWQHLHQRLQLASRLMQRQFRLQLQLELGEPKARHLRLISSLAEDERMFYSCASSLAVNSAPGGSRSPEWLLDEQRGQLSVLINDIQYEAIDFFLQVEQADLIVSDILTAAILIWLISWAALTFYSLAEMDESVPLIVKAVQLFGVFVITLATLYLLTLHKCCTRSYKLICTLMAHEQTHRTKRQFIKLLEFFSERNRTTYTLFQHYPYLATTYISIIGWSFSCSAVAYALLGRERTQLGRRN